MTHYTSSHELRNEPTPDTDAAIRDWKGADPS
ncbi:hypothetical protein WP2_042 [Pseudomonas phage WP2]